MKTLALLVTLALASAATPIDRPPRVFVIGDSISMHYGPYLRAALGPGVHYDRKRGDGHAWADLDRPVGANGGDSRAVLAYLRARAAAGGIDADVLLFNCGLHDIKTPPTTGRRQVDPDLYARTLDTILNVVDSLGVAPVWMRTTPVVDTIHNRGRVEKGRFRRFAADVALYNRLADSVMASRDVPAVDLHALSESFGPEAFADHVHYHEPYRRRQGDYLAGYLAGYLATRGEQGR